jgi:hypothetical protein
MHKFVKIEKVLLKIQIIFLFIILYLFLFKNIFILKLFVLIPMFIISIVNSILTLKARKLKNEVLELSRESERELAREAEKELKKEILEDKMKEEEFFNNLRNLVWNVFPYCRLNRLKFEDIVFFDVYFIYLNIERHLRYRIDVNGIKKRSEELALQVLNDIKKFQIDDID